MLDTVLENLVQKIHERYFGRKRKLKGPKLHVRRNGSVDVSVYELLTSEAGRNTVQKVHNSPFTQAWLAKHGYKTGPIDLTKAVD